MKQISKRLFGAFLAIIMVVSMVPNSILKVTATNASTQSTYVAGDIITYGSYPQTKVTSSSLTSALDAQTPQADNTVTYAGSKYKKVYLSEYTYYLGGGTGQYPSNTYQDDNGYYINKIYWFKYEPTACRRTLFSGENEVLF